MRRVLPLVVVGALLLSIVVVVAWPASYEQRLEQAVSLGGQVLSCDNKEPDFYVILLDSDADGAPDILAYGEIKKGNFTPPIAYVFYAGGEYPTGGLVRGQTYTFAEIQANWPTPCDLRKEGVK